MQFAFVNKLRFVDVLAYALCGIFHYQGTSSSMLAKSLTGSGFGASQGQVLIGGVAQNVNTWSDTSITFTTVRGSQSLGACRVDVVGGLSEGLSGPALYTRSGNEASSGTIFIAGSLGDSMVYDNTRAYSGTQSLKCRISLGQPPATCGGSHSFGGRMTWATGIPEGYNIWYRARFYLPSTLPMGYCFGGADSADAATCGKQNDGSGNLKWLALEDNTQTAIGYLNLGNQRRAVALANNVSMNLDLESGAEPSYSVTIPRDEWFTLQIHVYLSSASGGGFMRSWVNGAYVGQLTQKSIASGRTIKGIRLGNYWNGVPWTDGTPTHTDVFWMDDVIVATDYTGYGAPTSTDAVGRALIGESVTVENL